MARTSRAFWGGLLTKFSALVCACALWLYVDSVAMKTKTIEVRPTITREDGREVAGLAARAPVVLVTVRGPAGAVDHITAAVVSCTGWIPNDYAGGPATVSFAVDRVTLPASAGLRVLSVSPSAARLDDTPATF